MGSPQDQANLAPVDVREHSAWTQFIGQISGATRPSRLSDARGWNADATSRPINLLVTRVLPTDSDVQAFRAARAMKVEPRKRGHQAHLPSSQELIRQITGIGSPSRGR